MPLLSSEHVKVPVWQFNGHLQTIAPNVLRKPISLQYKRERIATWDNDFLDLDWSIVGSDTLLIISHGLAGSSDALYMKGFAKVANDNQWDALAWNYRGCSGEPNKQLFSFHAGKTDDLAWVIKHADATKRYKYIYLVGISMGGNLSLKLLGEWGQSIPYPIRRAVAISVPVNMLETSYHLIKGWNKIYSKRYLKQYIEQLRTKQSFYPDAFDYRHVYASDNLHTFVERFTAPSFGFKSAEDYLKSQSAIHYLYNIYIPTLLINADNDPFLTSNSFPKKEAARSDFFHFLLTRNGGHVGFDEKKPSNYNWMERRAMEFLTA